MTSILDSDLPIYKPDLKLNTMKYDIITEYEVFCVFLCFGLSPWRSIYVYSIKVGFHPDTILADHLQDRQIYRVDP